MAEENDKHYAVRRIVRQPNGTTKVIFTDTKTGLQVFDTTGYETIESKGFLSLDDLGIDPNKTDVNEPTVAQNVVESTVQPTLARGDAPSEMQGSNFAGRQASNNYGFIDKPNIMNYASFIPGPMGTMGKLANFGINLNNTVATNRARESIGLDPRGAVGTFAGGFSDNKGYVADVQYSDNTGNLRTTPVSFKAEDPVGRTTLTPDEARMRGLLNPSGIKEAPKQDVRTARDQFRDAFPDQAKSVGIFGRLKDLTSNIVNSVSSIGRTNTRTGPTAMNPQGITLDSRGFPSAPSAPNFGSGNDNSFGRASPSDAQPTGWGNSNVGNANSPNAGGGRTDSFGGSSQADAASRSGGAGLY